MLCLIIISCMFNIHNSPILYSSGTFNIVPSAILNQLNELGNNSSPVMTEEEGLFLDSMFNTDSLAVSLVGKTVFFLTGNLGMTVSIKKDFFKCEYDRYKNNHPPLPGFIYIFDSNQQELCGGYYAAIVYYTKNKPTVKQVIKTIKRYSRSHAF